jgi:agmatine/peptidylarginine deiminase
LPRGRASAGAAAGLSASPAAATLVREAATGLGIPGEFEPMDGIILPLGELLDRHPQLAADVLVALRGHVRVYGLVSDLGQAREVEQKLDTIGLEMGDGDLEFLAVPTDTLWVRDYGPVFIRRPGGGWLVYDPPYDGDLADWREEDDRLPRYVAGYFRLPVLEAPLFIEGGDILSNGQGIYVTTWKLPRQNVEARGMTPQSVKRVIYRKMFARTGVILENIEGELTGHVDMFVAFTGPQDVVVARCDPREDPENAARLDAAAAHLAEEQQNGERLRVHRVRNPARDGDVWPSYTNIIQANGVVLVPQYPTLDPQLDAEALAFFEKLCPDRTVIGIDCTELITQQGALHCICVHVPVMTPPNPRRPWQWNGLDPG